MTHQDNHSCGFVRYDTLTKTQEISDLQEDLQPSERDKSLKIKDWIVLLGFSDTYL